MRNCTVPILLGYGLERLIGSLVGKRMKEGDGTIEFLLYLRLARSWERYSSQPFWSGVIVYFLSC